MTTKRIEFPGGWWAELRTAWSYGADSRIATGWGFAEGAEGFEKACITTLNESVVEAKLPDIHGVPVVFGPEMWAAVDGRIARKILRTCRDLWGEWQEESDPKDTGRRSSESPQESPPTSPSE